LRVILNPKSLIVGIKAFYKQGIFFALENIVHTHGFREIHIIEFTLDGVRFTYIIEAEPVQSNARKLASMYSEAIFAVSF
jgi:hypothetical protein